MWRSGWSKFSSYARHSTEERTVSKTYKAFISYKHIESSDVAAVLEAALKSYLKPLLSLPIRICRDEKHFAPGPDLPNLILRALDQSEFFILLASPQAATSP